MAHGRVRTARAIYAQAELLGANINRSPSAYTHNPRAERDRYEHDVDKTLAQVRFESTNGEVLGVINWFAVHPTSMNNTNKLVSSDNVGYASILMEKELNGPGVHPGRGKIVCAFASTNLGDVSPNTRGPHCERSGRVCDNEHLLCAAGEKCFASGPGVDMFDSTRIIATKMFDTAMELLRSPGEDVTGDGEVRALHQYVAMPEQRVRAYDPLTDTFNSSKIVEGCLPAMGYSFAAGTTDGPGVFNFTQGTTSSNPLWDAVRDFIAEPTVRDVACHAPKPILLATGRMPMQDIERGHQVCRGVSQAKFPYEWQPQIVSCSVARVGRLLLAAVPGEFTTMSGRRLRRALAAAAGPQVAHVVVAGLANVYADYIATPEEYQAQRYEGASTIYGPHTLDIYLNKYVELTAALMQVLALSSLIFSTFLESKEKL
ncbi:Neutral ceramidase [Eumeta japonica]|uniref:Neutral ceramidase n=1 Tax=Eumeta variegata TaxID=151549 RepID=A0A4C1YQ82_EUMVA|nr:Neutral ceramidase [Eumeta japonica]